MFRLLGVAEGRLLGTVSRAQQLNVNGDRYLQVHGGCPETIVFRRRIALAAWRHAQRHRLEAFLGAALHLRDHVVARRPGQDAQADQTAGIGGAVLLRQPVVVGVHHGQVGVVVSDIAP